MKKQVRKTLKKLFSYLSLHNEGVFTLLVFVLVYGFIFLNLDIKSIFADTHITGGDNGSHIYIPEYLKEIFPRIKWWSPDWYSGFPFLYFYPPLMYLPAVGLSYLMPLNIAFKLVVFSGAMIYPLAFFYSLRWLGMKSPIPQLGAVFSLFLLFLETYTIYGGNLASLLSGQFSHTISIALLFMFVGLMYKGAKEGKYHIWNCILGASIILTHPISGILLAFLFLSLPFQTKDVGKNIKYALSVYIGIFLLSAFWTFGAFWYRDFGGEMYWAKTLKTADLFPGHWLPLVALAGAGVIYAAIKKERKLLGVFTVLWLSLLFYFSLDRSFVANTRFLPYLSFGILFIAAYFLGSALLVLKKYSLKLFILVFAVVLGTSFWSVKENTSFVPAWFKWSMGGYEAKESWPEAEKLFAQLKELPRGRVMWEHHPEHGKYGTTRALEAIPLFSGQPTYEGLLAESAITAPFHFINQGETSESPQSNIMGLDSPSFDFDKGVGHMEMSGTRHFVAFSDTVKKSAEGNSSMKKVKDTGPFSIYELSRSTLVEPIKSFEVQRKEKNWKDVSLAWHKNADAEKPVVFAENREEENYLKNIGPSDDIKLPKNIKETKDSIEFDAESIGRPHLVKISYFPTWRAQGAKGPYLVSPAYMLVVPTENHVKLSFSYGLADWAGIATSIAGAGYLALLQKKLKTRNRGL